MRDTLATVFLSSVMLCIGLFGHGCAGSPKGADAHPHQAYESILKQAVKKDGVDYATLVDNKDLAHYLKWVAHADLNKMPSKDARLAFYINAYNALTLRSVLHFWPNIKSVSDVVPNFGFFKVTKHKVAGQDVTLDDIENTIIRPTFNDPRIHAALNCASRSCPPLAPFAFTEAGLDQQLDTVFRRFANDDTRNQISVKERRIQLSKLFEWY